MTIREAIFALQQLEKLHPGADLHVGGRAQGSYWCFDLMAIRPNPLYQGAIVEVGRIKYEDTMSSGSDGVDLRELENIQPEPIPDVVK